MLYCTLVSVQAFYFILHSKADIPGSITATAFAGLIAAGIFQLDGKLGIAGWYVSVHHIDDFADRSRGWLHIIIGCATAVITIICYRGAQERSLGNDRISKILSRKIWTYFPTCLKVGLGLR